MTQGIRPLGMEGAQARVSELHERLRRLRGEPETAFAETLDQVQEQRSLRPPILRGAFGLDEGFRPLSPTLGGIELRPLVAPPMLKAMAASAARSAGIDPFLFDALIETESAYNPLARSSKGAMGLAQLMPGTARELGVTDPFDPVQNLNGGARYLARMLEEFGDVRLALAAYNAGPGRVRAAGGIPNIAETQRYVETIMNRVRDRQGVER